MRLAFLELPADEGRLYTEQAATRRSLSLATVDSAPAGMALALQTNGET